MAADTMMLDARLFDVSRFRVMDRLDEVLPAGAAGLACRASSFPGMSERGHVAGARAMRLKATPMPRPVAAVRLDGACVDVREASE